MLNNKWINSARTMCLLSPPPLGGRGLLYFEFLTMRVKVYALWRLVYGSNSRNETSSVWTYRAVRWITWERFLNWKGQNEWIWCRYWNFLLESASAIWRLQRVAGRFGTLPTRPHWHTTRSAPRVFKVGNCVIPNHTHTKTGAQDNYGRALMFDRTFCYISFCFWCEIL